MQPTHALDCQIAPPAAWPLPGRGLVHVLNRFLGGFLPLDRLSGLYEAIQGEADSRSSVDRALSHLDVSYDIVHGTLEAIPREGPLLVIANHPFGGVEGLVLLSLLTAVRSKGKVMANQILSGVPELPKYMMLVDPFGGPEAAAQNLAPVRQSLRWLATRGALGMFPAGDGAHFDPAHRSIRESEWHGTVTRLMRHSGAAVLPVFFDGANGPLFQLAGLLHPKLRTAMLVREMANKTGCSLKVSIGRVIPSENLDVIRDDTELTRYLRMRVDLLGVARAAVRKQKTRRIWGVRRAPVAPAGAAIDLAREVAWLPPEHELAKAGDYRVYIAGANQIPCLVGEIARLREATFRAVGEGTGRARDMDVFDPFYQHLFVWNEKTMEVVGAYRLGLTDKLLRQFGLDGLHTSTLFNYELDLIRMLSPAIEIGRSFVRQEYQRKHLPLLLLWKGIGTYVARNPKYRNLFGTVSLSSRYSEASRQLVALFFEQEKLHGQAPNSVRPRNPLSMKGNPAGNARDTACRIPGLEALSEMVSELEPDGKGIPVLMRHYLRLGGRVLGCNVDPKFNRALDALVVVDLPRTDPRLLEVYMGKLTPGYLRHHGVDIGEEKQAQSA